MQIRSYRFREIVGFPRSYLRRRSVLASLTVIGVLSVMLVMHSGSAQGQRAQPVPECSTGPAQLHGGFATNHRLSLAVANVGDGLVQANLRIVNNIGSIRAQQTFFIDPGDTVELNHDDSAALDYRGVVRILATEFSHEKDFDTLLPTLTMRSQKFDNHLDLTGEVIIVLEHCHEV